jgi:alcohol dehydrogenase class IV
MTTDPFQFQFSLRTQVRFGCGVRREVKDVLVRNGWRRTGVVVDHNLLSVPLVAQLLADLKAAGETVVVPCTIMEPDYHALEAVRKAFEGHELDAFIGLGGGSALDMAKAQAVLVKNRGPAISYRGFDKMTAPVLPIIAIPTTAGTGSEVTPNASFVDSDGKKKMGINGEAVRPVYAFLDPELTLSCPIKPTLSAGVDSLVHATEAYVAKKSNPMARFFAREGFTRVFLNLPKALQEPGHPQYRTEVMFGAFLSGVALMHSGTGPAAALSYPLGVHYKVPHGVGGAIFLPHVAAHNVSQGVYDYRELLTITGAEAASARDGAEAFLRKMFDTWKIIGVPQNLQEIHPNIDMNLMIQDTLELKGALDQNPTPFGRDELRQILLKTGVVERV